MCDLGFVPLDFITLKIKLKKVIKSSFIKWDNHLIIRMLLKRLQLLFLQLCIVFIPTYLNYIVTQALGSTRYIVRSWIYQFLSNVDIRFLAQGDNDMCQGSNLQQPDYKSNALFTLSGRSCTY